MRAVALPPSFRYLSAVGLALVASSISACPGFFHSPTDSGDPPVDRTVTLAVGSDVHLRPSLSLALDRIVSDSRCPLGATCVWEGEVVVALALRSSHGAVPFVLSDHARHTSAGPCDVTLLSVLPLPALDRPPTPDEYRVTVRAQCTEPR